MAQEADVGSRPGSRWPTVTRMASAEPRPRAGGSLGARLRAVGKADVPAPEAAAPPRRRPSRPAAGPRGGGSTVPPALAVAAAWGWRALIVGAVAYFVLRFLATIAVVVIPLALALILAALLHRPALFLRRYLRPSLAGILTLLGGLAVIGGVIWFVVTQAQAQSGQLMRQAQGVVDNVRALAGRLPGVGQGSGDLFNRVDTWVQTHTSTLLSGVFTFGQVAVDLLIGLVLTIFLTLFFLIDGEREWSWLIRLLPRSARPAANGAGHRAWQVLSGYIVGTAIIALIHGVVIGFTLWALGTPLVIVLAVLVFVGSFIPIIGAFLFGGLAVLVTLVTLGWQQALILLIVLIVENLLEGHVYQPLIMGRTVSLHPVAVLLALAAGGVLAGIVGAIVAIPVVGSVHAAVKYLTGVEDIRGNSLRDEDRMEPEDPPEALVPQNGRANPAPRRRTPAGATVAGLHGASAARP